MRSFRLNDEKKILFISLVVFILTELVDDLLDHVLGTSIMHSIFQFILFLVLFFIIARLFLGYYKSKVNKLILPELREILVLIHKSESEANILNQRTIMKHLNITKPTLAKRLSQLEYLEYIIYEKKGNSKYIHLTKLGKSIAE